MTPAANAVQTVYARVQSLAGQTAFLVLNSAAPPTTSTAALQADRSVIGLTTTTTGVRRCTGAGVG